MGVSPASVEAQFSSLSVVSRSVNHSAAVSAVHIWITLIECWGKQLLQVQILISVFTARRKEGVNKIKRQN